MKAQTNRLISTGLVSVLALVLGFTANEAAAVPSYCSGPGGNDDGLLTSDMTYNGSNADDCYGVVEGNINQASDLNGLNLTWGTDWTLLATDNVPPTGGEADNTGTFMGIQFTLAASSGTSGTWTLTGVDVGDPLDLPATLDFVGALKAGNEYALYLFDDVIFDGNDGGTWSIEFTNQGGQIPDLSHLTLFVRAGAVPEPGVLFLMGAGLLGLGLSRRRKPA